MWHILTHRVFTQPINIVQGTVYNWMWWRLHSGDQGSLKVSVSICELLNIELLACKIGRGLTLKVLKKSKKSLRDPSQTWSFLSNSSINYKEQVLCQASLLYLQHNPNITHDLCLSQSSHGLQLGVLGFVTPRDRFSLCE